MIKNINLINAIVLFAIFLLFDFLYINSITEMFRYMGFVLSKPNMLKNISAYAISILIIYAISFKTSQIFPKLILQLIAIFLVFPSLIMFENSNADFQILIAHLLFFFIAFIFLNYIKIRFKGKTLRPQQKLPFLLILTILLVIPFIITYKTNINLKNFLLIDIYETRALQKELSNPYLGYVFSWLGSIIIPIGLIFSFMQSSKSKSFLLVILLAYLFLIGAHKSVLIGSIVLIIFYFVPKKYIVISAASGVLLLLLLDVFSVLLLDNYLISSLITRRVFFIPALLDTYYFDFFNGKPLYWSSSFLRSIFNYPYEVQPPYLIANKYFNKPNMSANNGLISDGYSNLGWFGIIINVFIVSGIFSFFNSLRINHKFFGLFILFLFSLVSSYLPTVLLTHGGILLLILSQLILKDTEPDFNKAIKV